MVQSAAWFVSAVDSAAVPLQCEVTSPHGEYVRPELDRAYSDDVPGVQHRPEVKGAVERLKLFEVLRAVVDRLVPGVPVDQDLPHFE